MKAKNFATCIILAVVGLLCALYLTSCESIRIRGGIETDYGTITSDGKTATVTLRLPQGYGK